MTVRTVPGRPATRSVPAAPDALIVDRGTIAPGRARGVPPLRREGPEKLTGEAKYADDLVVPGAWYGATIRSTDAHARFVALESDPDFDWSTGRPRHRRRHPGRQPRRLDPGDQPILVPVGGEIQHHAEPLALLAAPDRATLRAAKRRLKLVTEPLPPIFDPLESASTSSPITTSSAGDVAAGFAAADVDPRGRVPGRPPGAAVHREQRDDRGARRGRRRHRHTARCSARTTCTRRSSAALALDDRQARGRPGGDRRRLRRQGGVPVDDRAARRAARAEGRAAGADDLRPPRGHRRHDQAASGDRPPPDGRDPRRAARRAGHRGRHGRRRVLHADAGRAVARRAPRRRPVPLPERPHPRPGDAHEHAAERRVPRLRRAADRVRGRDAPQPHRRAAGHLARSSSAAATSTAWATSTPTGQVLRESVAGEEVLERAAEAAEFERIRDADGAARDRAAPGWARPDRATGRARSARASGSRSPGTAPASRAPARSSSRASPRRARPQTAGSAS